MKQSKVFKPVLAILALAMVGGCAVKPAPNSTTVPVVTHPAIKISGTLRINISWPNSYNTALLPNSTNRVVVQIKKDGTTVATKEVNRTNEPSISTTLKVDAGSGYNVEVDGYRDVTPVAHGAASGVNVKSGRLTTVPTIHMTALTVPAINSVANADGLPVAKVGDTVTLQGINLGAEATLSLAINLNGTSVPAENITRVGTGSIQVVVPAGTTCGTMSVKVDNVSTVTDNPLWIVDSVALPATASIVNFTTLTLAPTIGWALSGGDTADKFGTPPDPLYTVNPDTQGTVTGNVFAATATSPGPISVTPKMGSLVGGSIAVTILPSIDSVTLNTSAATINATSDGTEPTSTHPSTVSLVATVNGDAFNNGVTWSSSNAALASVDANGLVTANNNGASGSVTITATSKDDPTETAQATITITNKGVVEVGVE